MKKAKGATAKRATAKRATSKGATSKSAKAKGAGAKAAGPKPSAREQLAEYRAKRDFQRTAEPEGGSDRAAPASKLEFVIQKHAATRLHYDLRLELDEVMK